MRQSLWDKQNWRIDARARWPMIELEPIRSP